MLRVRFLRCLCMIFRTSPLSIVWIPWYGNLLILCRNSLIYWRLRYRCPIRPQIFHLSSLSIAARCNAWSHPAIRTPDFLILSGCVSSAIFSTVHSRDSLLVRIDESICRSSSSQVLSKSSNLSRPAIVSMIFSILSFPDFPPISMR